MTTATIRYHVRALRLDGSLSIGIAAQAIADSVGGVVRSTVPLYDGEHDLALIDVPADASGDVEELLGADPTVASYSTTGEEG